MNNKLFIFRLIIILSSLLFYQNKFTSFIQYSQNYTFYVIFSYSSNFFFTIKNKNILLSNQQTNFRLIFIKFNKFFIESRAHKRLGISSNNNIIIYEKKENPSLGYILWNIIKINNNKFLIQNEFNKKYLEVNNNILQCKNNYSYFYNSMNNKTKINYHFIFNFIKVFEEGIVKKNYLRFIQKEPIDLVIKYIDLTDKNLTRIGIKQIYKDIDNEELRYSIRSILEYIPWIRNIYIIMPNEKVKFFKSIEEIKDKIKYIKDREILGFDTANIFAFTFNLYKLRRFGVSKNFIYMEDDFFIGKSLKKADFFYYDEKLNKVLPYLLTWHFREINKTDILNKYDMMSKIKDSIHPHSREGWWFSTYSTEKFFIENYNKNTLITTNFTHNAISENIEDLKEIFEEIKKYKYIKETLLSKERHILTLNQPHFVNLYQLNIKHKKVHSISYKYIEMEKINKYKLYIPLFVINTGGNHIPLNRHYNLQKKIMEKRFPYQTKYELKSNKKIKYTLNIKIYCIIFKLYLLFFFLKLFQK